MHTNGRLTVTGRSVVALVVISVLVYAIRATFMARRESERTDRETAYVSLESIESRT